MSFISYINEAKNDIKNVSGKSTWHVISNEGISLAVLASEKDADLYVKKAASGYYNGSKVKEVKDNYAHWSKYIIKAPKDPSGLW